VIPSDLSGVEDLVATAWEDALGRGPVDRDSDYRTLRVNPNRALRIIHNIWSATSIELPINIFFEAPTVRQMARALCDDRRQLAAPDLVCLRSGDQNTPPLFLFPGGVGVLIELMDLAQALDYRGAIYGIAFSGLDGVGPVYDRIEQEAARSLAIMRRLQPNGPYRMIGYSFGGITALETARKIRQQRGEEAFLCLLDTAQNDHAWPLRVWLPFMLRKIAAKLKKMKYRRPAQKNPHEYSENPQPPRGTQLEFRFRNPNHPNYPYYHPYWRGNYPPFYGQVAQNACRMRGRYMPSRYDGKAFFFASAGGDSLVCDPLRVWPKYLPNAEWTRVPGNHLSMILGRNAVFLAAEISRRLDQTLTAAPDSAPTETAHTRRFEQYPHPIGGLESAFDAP
jgi:thioesterase domain-containing protein